MYPSKTVSNMAAAISDPRMPGVPDDYRERILGVAKRTYDLFADDFSAEYVPPPLRCLNAPLPN